MPGSLMTSPRNPALHNHLRRYGNIDDDGDDDKIDTSSSESPDIDDTGASEEQYFLSPIVAWLFHLHGDVETNGVAQWWHRNRPFIVESARKYGALLMALLLPFTPRAARQAGYRGASHTVFKALDHLDASLPGSGQGWSKRWMNRPRGRPDAGFRASLSMEGTVGNVGVAAAAVVFAAVSWCSWRRSSPSWPILLLELACGSTWAANYVARGDGRREAKLLEIRLITLENSLAPFFRGVETCTRMVKCAQALSFGLRLSVPMPPVARMESHSSTHEVPEGKGMALRDLRVVLMDVIQGGIERADACRKMRSSGLQETENNVPDSGEGDDRGTNSGTRQNSLLLTCVAKAENRLAATLRCFVSELADRIDQAIAGPEEWGFWWKSQLVDSSDAVRDMVEYFDAASFRLEMAIGCGSPFCTPKDRSRATGGFPTLAETISALRLSYEEVVVRLFVCQDRVQAALRDQARSTNGVLLAVRQALGDAVESVEAAGTLDDLWSKAKSLVERETVISDPAEVGSPTPQEGHPDTARHLEAGVGWVSLATPRKKDPGFFEGGDGEEGADDGTPTTPDLRVTDVLVGVASPGRSHLEGGDDGAFDAGAGEIKAERTRSQLLGELGSVLRGRPLPPTCEKRLPLESQQDLCEGDDDEQDVCGDGDDQRSEARGGDRSLSMPSPTESPGPPEPVLHNAIGQDLLSELRAQISLAVNEEIFSSERHRWTVESDAEEDSILVQHEGSPPADERVC